jgi:hypothetical protein
MRLYSAWSRTPNRPARVLRLRSILTTAGKRDGCEISIPKRMSCCLSGKEKRIRTLTRPTRSKDSDGRADNYLSITNPEEEPDRYSVPKLLRRTADRIDELGNDVVVNDLILHIEVTPEGYLPSINVYYYYEKDE